MDRDRQPAGGAAIKVVTAAWLLTAVFYFWQYMMRSAPAVMVPELSAAFGLTATPLDTVLASVAA